MFMARNLKSYAAGGANWADIVDDQQRRVGAGEWGLALSRRNLFSECRNGCEAGVVDVR